MKHETVLSASAMFAFGRNTVHACFARRIRESEASRLLRTKHVNANEFALLSASEYFCT